MEQVLVSAAQQLEKQLDSEIGRLDNLGADDLEAIRERRLKEMKQRQEKMIQWKQNVQEENMKRAIKRSSNWHAFHFRDTANTRSWSTRRNSSRFRRKARTLCVISTATERSDARSWTSIWRSSRLATSKQDSARSTQRNVLSLHSVCELKSFPALPWSKTAKQKITSWDSRTWEIAMVSLKKIFQASQELPFNHEST